MILNLILLTTAVVYFVVPTVMQYREGQTRRESITLAAAQFGVLAIIGAIVTGITLAIAFYGPSWV